MQAFEEPAILDNQSFHSDKLLTIAQEIEAMTDPSFMTSLARGLAVVRAFSDQRRSLTIAQISHKTGIPRAAVRERFPTGDRVAV